MTLRIDLAWLIGTLLLAARVAAATMLTPVFGPSQIPGPVRVFIALALAAFLILAVPVAMPPIDYATDLAVATLGELVLGASLAFGFLVAYAATQIAGRVLDIQLGYGAASVLNPDHADAGAADRHGVRHGGGGGVPGDRRPSRADPRAGAVGRALSAGRARVRPRLRPST